MIEKIIDTAVILLLNSKNEILLQKKDLGYLWFPGKWCMFGGGIEPEEDPMQTLTRELKEELGSVPSEVRLFKKTRYTENYFENRKRGGEFHVYTGLFTGKISDISLNEGGGFAFFAKEELSSVPIIDYNLVAINEYYDSLTSR